MANTTVKVPYRVVDGVRQSYPTPWGALEKGDHVMLWLPKEVRHHKHDNLNGSAWCCYNIEGVARNVFVLDEDSALTILPKAENPDDPQDRLETYAVWGFLHLKSYKYDGPDVPAVGDL